MKKNFVLYACAAAALVFASCQKEEPTSDNNKPAKPEEPVATDMSVITATADQTKVTTVDGVNMLWEDADRIKLFTRIWNETQEKFDAGWCDYVAALDAPSSTASFAKDETDTKYPDNTSGKYVAAYLKGASAVTQSRDYNAQFALNKEQIVENGGGFASSMMYSSSENSEFVFSHMVSYIKFTVDAETTPFNKLTISPIDDSEYIVSRIKVDFANAPFVEVIPLNASGSAYSQSSKTVSLVSDDGENFAPGTYYIAINPWVYTDGLKFTFENGEAVCKKEESGEIMMTAGDVADMGTIGTLDFPTVSDKLGTLYSKNGVQGVVFWVNPDQPSVGKIISAAGCKAKWGSSATYSWASNIDSNDGAVNSNYVLGVDGSSASTFPAVYFCKNLGEGWYLPSLGEVKELAKTYYGVVGDLTEGATYFGVEPYATNAAAFDSVLAQIATDDEATEDLTENKIAMMKTTWYWTSNGNASNSKIWRVKFNTGYATGSAGANNDGAVRCVREVTLD